MTQRLGNWYPVVIYLSVRKMDLISLNVPLVQTSVEHFWHTRKNEQYPTNFHGHLAWIYVATNQSINDLHIYTTSMQGIYIILSFLI